ncbi:hypothetical protein NOCA2150143 [metagenome]|uniref:Dynamin N-terminal domain-containing protein n=1 Tax=metagenome TaxID=256318 RepID=A0A2P2BXC2_9ZZZZ
MPSEQSVHLRLAAEDARLVRRVLDTLQRVGNADDLTQFVQEARGTGGLPTFVVVGEVKRGKSTLVNALAGAEVSPTGVDVVTAGYLAVVPAGVGRPSGSATLYTPDGVVATTPLEAALAIDATADWSTRQALGAEIVVDTALVPEAVLIDTPGVGGLDPDRHVRTLAAARTASALVFVLDAGQPITRPELAFLAEVAQLKANVVLVMTRIDRNPAHWRSLLEENRSLLAQHVPRFAQHTIHPVSAALALRAQQGPTPRDSTLEASGIPALAQGLRTIASQGDRLGLLNALQIGQASLERAIQELSVQLEVTRSESVVPGLQAEQERLLELRRQQRRIRLDVEREFQRVRRSAHRFVNQACDELVATMSKVIKAEKWGMTKAAHAEFDATLKLNLEGLADQSRGYVEAELSALVARAFASLAATPEGVAGQPLDLERVDLGVLTRAAYSLNPLFDPHLASTAFVGSRVALLVGAGGPIGLLMGGGALALNVFVKSRRTGQQELAGTLHETSARARQELREGIDGWLGELRPELYVALEDFVSQSITLTKKLVEEAQTTARSSEQERQQAAKNLENRLAAAQERLDEVVSRLKILAVPEHSEVPLTPMLENTTPPVQRSLG